MPAGYTRGRRKSITRHRIATRLRPAVFAAAVLVALLVAPSALGHSALTRTAPEDDQTVQETPDRVVLEFNEPVETALGAVRVYDSAARRVDAGDFERPDAETVSVGLDGELEDGTYTVAWRVVSADAHPIQGAFVFHVGAPGANAAGIAEEVLDQGAPRSVEVTFTVVRFLSFAAILLVAGGVATLGLALRDEGPSIRRILWYVVGGAALALALLAPVSIVLQGASAGGTPLGEALDRNVIEAVLDTRFGQVMAVRVFLGLALVVLAVLLARRVAPALGAGLLGAAAVLAFGLAIGPSLYGHAAATGALSFVTDVVHVLAASVWTGGLAFVVAALILAGGERWELATRAVPRFSNAAVVSVALLLVAGTINGYLQVRSWSALWETTYGLLLVAKLALVIPLLGLGAFNNRYAVPRLRAGIASLVERRRFLRAAWAELAIMVTIVGITAVLVNEPPAKAEAAASAASEGSPEAVVTTEELHIQIAADPGTAGPNDLNLIVHALTPGEPIAAVTVQATLPAEEIGPLEFEAEEGDPALGEYVVPDADLAIAGKWDMQIQVRRGEFDALAETLSITIGKDS